MRNPFKSLALALITMFAGIAAFAQVTTASLGGRVVDQNGEPVIGAAIVAIHEPSGTSYGSVTNVDGLPTWTVSTPSRVCAPAALTGSRSPAWATSR